MKYYENEIYPISLVLSYDAESINKEYRNAAPDEDDEIKDNHKVLARTMFLSRRTNDYYAMAVGIIFNKKPNMKTILHESLHAVKMMLDVGIDMPLSDQTEEAYAYLIGWIGECIEDFINANKWKPTKEQMTELTHLISGCSCNIEVVQELQKQLEEI